ALPERGVAASGRVGSEAVQPGAHGFPNEAGRRVARLTDGHAHLANTRRRAGVRHQPAEFFEGVGMQRVEAWIHGGNIVMPWLAARLAKPVIAQIRNDATEP